MLSPETDDCPAPPRAPFLPQADAESPSRPFFPPMPPPPTGPQLPAVSGLSSLPARPPLESSLYPPALITLNSSGTDRFPSLLGNEKLAFLSPRSPPGRRKPFPTRSTFWPSLFFSQPPSSSRPPPSLARLRGEGEALSSCSVRFPLFLSYLKWLAFAFFF